MGRGIAVGRPRTLVQAGAALLLLIGSSLPWFGLGSSVLLWSVQGSSQDAAGAVSVVILLVVLVKLLSENETVHSRRFELAVTAGPVLIYTGLFAYAYRDVGRFISMLGNPALETHIGPGLYVVVLGLALFAGSTVMRRR